MKQDLQPWSPTKASHSRRADRTRLIIEALESRWCPSLTLTQAGRDAGIVPSVFAGDFPNTVEVGPLGMAFPSSGGVLVSDYPGNVRLFPTDNDGQSADWFPASQSFGQNNADDLTQLGDNIYMSQHDLGRIVQLHTDGTLDHVVASGLPAVLGLRANPATGRLFAAVQGNNQIVDVDPNNPQDLRIFANVGGAIHGLTLSEDGSRLYVAQKTTGHILGFDTATRQQVFDSGAISGGLDGVAEGVGPLAGKLFANTNGNGMNTGTVVEVDIATNAQTVIADHGSRGDFVTTDPYNGSVLITQTDRIVRFTFPFGAATTLLVSGYPSPTVAGQVHGFTVTAQDAYGNTATDYRGTVHLTSSDPQAVLEGDYTFTAADHGSHSFGAILKTAGSQALTAADTSDGSITGTQGGIVVTPAPAVSFALSAPASVSSGTPFDVTVTAVDPYGNTDANYQGTLTFTTTDPDPGVVLPADYTFTLADGGVHTFTNTGLGETTLITPGDQTLTVTDTADGTITGSAIVTVASTAPGTGSHGLGQPPQRSTSPGQALTPRQPPRSEVVALDQCFALPNGEDAAGFRWLLIKAQRPSETDSWLADLFGREDLPLA